MLRGVRPSSVHRDENGDGIALDGGNDGGATRLGSTVRRRAGRWTPAVHALLAHLEARGFAGASRPLGIDSRGREILSYLEGETTGSRKPWPAWVHTDEALVQVADWLRRYHQAGADFVPPEHAVWRLGRPWERGLIIGHNDAAPYNAVWQDGVLRGFIDWDFAAPVPAEWDVAFTAFSWVPLVSRAHAIAEGFTDFAARRARLHRFLAAYGWQDNEARLLCAVRERIQASIDGIHRLAAAGEPPFVRLLADGGIDHLGNALTELSDFGT